MAHYDPIPFGKLLLSHGAEILVHVPDIESISDWVNTVAYVDHIGTDLRNSSKYDGIQEYWLWLERVACSPPMPSDVFAAAKRRALLRKRSDGIRYLAVQKVLDRYLHFHPEDYACPEREQEKIRQLQERMGLQAATQLERITQRARQLPLIEVKDALLTHYVFGAR